jgi:hypothetical protein
MVVKSKAWSLEISIVAISLVLIIRLCSVAAESGNTHGAIVSIIHIVLVASGTWITLRSGSNS